MGKVEKDDGELEERAGILQRLAILSNKVIFSKKNVEAQQLSHVYTPHRDSDWR
jgi:hypothetical protein